MKCYVCKYENDVFGKLKTSGGEWTCTTGTMPTKPIGKENLRLNFIGVGSVDIHVCPNCGALHSDMRHNILAKDRHD